MSTEYEAAEIMAQVNRWKEQIKRGLVSIASEARYEEVMRKGRQLGANIPSLSDMIAEANRERGVYGVPTNAVPEKVTPDDIQVKTKQRATPVNPVINSIDPNMPGSEYLLLLNRLVGVVSAANIDVPADLKLVVNIALENLLANRKTAHKEKIQEMQKHLHRLFKRAADLNQATAGCPSSLTTEISQKALEIETLRSMPNTEILGAEVNRL